MIVFDSSAVLAVLQSEPGASAVLEQLHGGSISVVNMAEIVSTILDRGGTPDAVTRNLDRLRMTIVPFDEAQARRAGELRPVTRHLGLSLGDRACLALAETIGARVLTADRNWSRLKLDLDIQLIR